MWISKKEYNRIIKIQEAGFDICNPKLMTLISGYDINRKKLLDEIERLKIGLEAKNKSLQFDRIKYGEGTAKLYSKIEELEAEVERLNILSINQSNQYRKDRKKWNDDCIKLNREIIELKKQLEEKEKTPKSWLDVEKEKVIKDMREQYEMNYINLVHEMNLITHLLSVKDLEKKDNEEDKDVKVKPYYFEEGNDANYPIEICTEICEYKKDGISIGSCSCRDCMNFIEGSNDFIKCKLRPKGKPKKDPKQPERFKRDEFGVISETDLLGTACHKCIYIENNNTCKECMHCRSNNTLYEYYSSK